MAFLRRRPDGRVEIRETRSGPRGPRARTLASFRGALGPDVLARAAERARGPFDAEDLAARARELGIPVTRRRRSAAARALLADLRRGLDPDPVLVTLLRAELGEAEAGAVPEDLAEAAEWIGVDDARRGRALRGLLRTADRIVRGRPRRRMRRRRRFPRFASQSARGMSA